MNNKYISLSPRLEINEQLFLRFCRKARRILNNCDGKDRNQRLRELREDLISQVSTSSSLQQLALTFSKSTVLDLLGLGWNLRIRRGEVQVASPFNDKIHPSEYKETIRATHLSERDLQLSQPSVIDFVRGMERRRLTSKGWHSIFSVMRDGSKLAKQFLYVLDRPTKHDRLRLLSKLIRPYIQPVTEGALCEQTGLPLQGIWRYFRHTWVNTYKLQPGRSMALLVRDAAAENHPVIGIAALGSSVAQQKLRDEWIGWDKESVIKWLSENPSRKLASWLLESVDELIQGIYLQDLFQEGICNINDIDYPTKELIKNLEDIGRRAIHEHRLYPQVDLHKRPKRNESAEVDWEAQALTSLFKSKRCKTLAKLMRIRQAFQNSGLKKGTKRELENALRSAKIRASIGQLARMIKAKHVGINIMDIIICGAVAPYNLILGGKLVCMMLCSPEVIQLYKKRYSKQVSIIASSMKGEAVIRHPQLVLLATTSLYGVGSSQYNRVQIPCETIGGKPGEKIRYDNLGKSEGYGSYQFSDLTNRIGSILMSRTKHGRRVHSIFGEGVNPKMRKLREAFDYIGFPSDDILQHRNYRIVYGIELSRNCREVLLGLNKKASYYIPLRNARERSDQIADYWCQRWLMGRINRDEILEQLSKHTLSYPVTHGARVILPEDKDNEEQLLF